MKDGQINLNRSKYDVGIIYSIALIIQLIVWFLYYPSFGYSDLTLNCACGIFFLFGIVLIIVLNLGWKKIGLGLDKLVQAIIIIIFVHLFFILIGLLLRQFGMEVMLFRKRYSFYAIFNNWILTGLGEELVFAGVLYTLIMRKFNKMHKWIIVLIVSLLFAIWHAPGYIAVGIKTGALSFNIIFQLLLNICSWLFIGTIYALSNNLWLAAFAHASTDYALIPMIINKPILGLFFMVVLILCGWFFQKINGKKDLINVNEC